MLLDSKLVFANNVSAAANNAVVSTNVNVIDTAASATLQNANADIGTGKEIWVKAVATVAFTTAMNVNFRLNHGSANNVANTALDGPTISTTTNLDPTNFANATDAQKTIYDGPLPAGLQRWIRGSLYCAGNVAAGNFDCYLYVK